MGKLNHKKSGAVTVLAAAFVLGIPSLPAHRYHLIFWAIAFVVEGTVIYALWPLDSN